MVPRGTFAEQKRCLTLQLFELVLQCGDDYNKDTRQNSFDACLAATDLLLENLVGPVSDNAKSLDDPAARSHRVEQFTAL